MVITSSTIKAWAKKPHNKDRALALGKRLFENQAKPENLLQLPSLGDFEDKCQHWAIKHPAQARILMISLAGSLLKK
jgi:hypothetical protein